MLTEGLVARASGVDGADVEGRLEEGFDRALEGALKGVRLLEDIEAIVHEKCLGLQENV